MTEPEDLIRTSAWVLPPDAVVAPKPAPTKKDPWWRRLLRSMFG